MGSVFLWTLLKHGHISKKSFYLKHRFMDLVCFTFMKEQQQITVLHLIRNRLDKKQYQQLQDEISNMVLVETIPSKQKLFGGPCTLTR